MTDLEESHEELLAAIRGRSTVRLEESIQSAITDYLSYTGWLVLSYARPRAHHALGGILPPGHPDLIAVKGRSPDGAQVIFVEVKTPKGRLSDDQVELHAQLREVGAAVFVWRSVEDAMAAFP